VEVVSLELRGPVDFNAAFDRAARERVEAIFPVEHNLIIAYRPRIVEFAVRSRLPGMYPSRVFVQDRGLMAYGASVLANYRRAAYYVDRILKGTNPADLPVEQPMAFEFVVNLKTARELGITFPDELRLQVTEVIQ
jgi:putative ABC transport system substrate-binding protein